MAENPQKEYWRQMWRQAYDNIPRKIIKKKRIEKPSQFGTWNVLDHYEYNYKTEAGVARTLMLLLGKPNFSKNGKPRSHHLHYTAAQIKGHRPKDQEVRRRLEILASSNGKLMAWMKLKEMGLEKKYEHP